MYNKQRKKMRNDIIFLIITLLIAVFSTYYIYKKFDKSNVVDYTSESFEITFKEDNGMNITLDKVIPVTDSVGLSSTPHTLIIKNNLTEKASYKIKLEEDKKKIFEDNCSEYQIPHEYIRVGIKDKNGNKKIFTLNEIENGILISEDIDALQEDRYVIRVWVKNGVELPINSNLHYHGIIKVEEGE